MNDICTVCGLPTHAEADEGKELCVRCYWWLDEIELARFETWIEERKEEHI
jgi:hypothetical protein